MPEVLESPEVIDFAGLEIEAMTKAERIEFAAEVEKAIQASELKARASTMYKNELNRQIEALKQKLAKEETIVEENN